MKLRLLIAMISFLYLEPGMGSILVDHQERENGFKYQIFKENIIPGYSAHLVVNHFNVGVLTPPSKNVSGIAYKDLFAAALERNKEAIKSLEATTKKLGSAAEGFEGLDNDVITESEVPPKNLEIDWHLVKDCIEFSLPLLKTRHKLEVKGQGRTDQDSRVLQAVTYQLGVRSGKGGLACGTVLGPYKDLVVGSSLANIKILLALHRRDPRQGIKVLRSVAGAFESGMSPSARELFAYYFLRLTWISAVERATHLPTYLQLNNELVDGPETFKVTHSMFDGEEFTEIIKIKKTDLAKAFLEGRQFLIDHQYWQPKFVGESR